MATSEEVLLPRRLGLGSATAVVIGSTIGSGIFRSPAAIADRLPGPLPLLLVWAVGGLLALCGALTLAEIASAQPRTGGIYVFLREGWGRLPAFLFGWAELVVIRAAALGAIAITFAEYLFRLFGWNPAVAPYDRYAHYTAALVIAVLAVANILGVRWVALIQNITTLAKYGGLLFLVALALFCRGPAASDHFLPLLPPGSLSASAFGLALVSVLWAFDGWADLSFVAGEVAEPQRNVPAALLLGTGAVLAVYLAANLAYLLVLPVAELRASRLVAAEVAGRLVGPAGVALVAVTVTLSTFGTLNGSLLTAPRIFFAMASDGLLFRRVAAVHPRFHTPYVAVLLTALLGIGFVLLRTFEQLTDAFVTAIVPFYALGVAAIFPMRRRLGHRPSFRVPGYPVVPALFVLASLLLLINAVADPTSRWATLAVLGTIAAGTPLFYLVAGSRV